MFHGEYFERLAKRGHLAATLLTSCFPNVSLFCHVHNICGGHKFCVHAAHNNVVAFCHGRATSQDTVVVHLIFVITYLQP